MEFKFLKLRDLQGKTPSFPAAGEVHIIYVPEPDDSNLHKAGAGRAMIREILSYYLCIDKGLVCLHESRHGKPYLASPATDGIFILIFLIPKATLHLQCQPLHH